MVYKVGAAAFIVESNRLIRKVTIIKRTGNFYIVRFADSDGAIQLRGSRLYATRDEAEKCVPYVRENKKRCKSPEEQRSL